jgi:hypothetical protein
MTRMIWKLKLTKKGKTTWIRVKIVLENMPSDWLRLTTSQTRYL